MKDGSSNPLYSRNARPQKALVACAQWEAKQPARLRMGKG